MSKHAFFASFALLLISAHNWLIVLVLKIPPSLALIMVIKANYAIASFFEGAGFGLKNLELIFIATFCLIVGFQLGIEDIGFVSKLSKAFFQDSIGDFRKHVTELVHIQGRFLNTRAFSLV